MNGANEMYTHLVESTCGAWLARLENGRWIGRPAKRVKGTWTPKASPRYDILVPNVTATTAL